MIESLIDYCLKNRFVVVMSAIFIAALGIYAVINTPIDALPDLSDNQVIIYTQFMGRAPLTVEDQVTYPLETAMMGLPNVKDVRGQSFYGFSLIYVIFDDSVDIYWARSRVLERLNSSQNLLPEGVTPQLGPEGTGVGHVLWYTVKGDGHSLADLRSIQDFYIKFQLASIDGVAECASIGGFVREYQVDLDPNLLLKHGVTSNHVVMALKKSNDEVGARLLEQSDKEFFLIGRGYVEKVSDIENVVVKTTPKGVPILIKHLGRVQLGTAIRRGLLDENGEGEVVGGIIVMRYGENAKKVIDRVKAKITDLERGLPEGVHIEIAHDRSELIESSLENLRHTLIEEGIIVSLIILIFLLHFRSAVVVIITIPLAILVSYIFMYRLGISSNIMSLGGVAIAIGVLVDASVVMVENAYRHLAEAQEKNGGKALSPARRLEIVGKAARQVGRPIFFSLLIIVLSFLPVFLLTGQEGKLFKPLAFTKTFAMLGSAVIAITLTPVLISLLMGGKLPREERNPVSAFFHWLYAPIVRNALKIGWVIIGATLVILYFTIPVYKSLGSEFMPNLNEGELVFMPVTLPGVSVTEAKRILTVQDKILKSHPQVRYVLGKVGRAETATDPAPVSMIETFVQFTPKDTWPKGKTINDIRSELDEMVGMPGVTNGWTMPIINRIQMLATGVRTDVGIKIYGDDLDVLARLAIEAEKIVKDIPGAADVFAERVVGGSYLNIDVDRKEAARYGLNVGDVQMIIKTALGGMPQTTTVEGRERYNIRVRYARDFRNNPGQILDLLIPTKRFGQIPLRMVASLTNEDGPPMINSENGLLRSLVFMNIRGRDMGSTVEAVGKALDANLTLPPGYYYRISGQWENQLRARATMKLLLPVVLVIIFILLFFTFGNITDTSIVMLSVPFALVGGVWMLAHFDYNMSVAVWVGFIALFGVAVETGVVMLVYLNEALDRIKASVKKLTPILIRRAAYEGASLRLRPILMTVSTSLIGLLPVLWSTGTGSEVMKPIAVPLIGGMISNLVLVLIVIPVLFAISRTFALKRKNVGET